MPRPGPRRPQVAVRLSADGIDALDALAADAGVNRSEMVRCLLAAAVRDATIRRAVTRRDCDG